MSDPEVISSVFGWFQYGFFALFFGLAFKQLFDAKVSDLTPVLWGMAPLCLLLPIAVFAVLLDISLSSLAPGEGFDPERSGEVLGMGREILAMGSMQTIVALVLAGLATRVARKRAPAG